MGLRDRFICDWASCSSVLSYVQKAQRRFHMVSLPMKYSKVNNFGGPINFKDVKGFPF